MASTEAQKRASKKWMNAHRKEFEKTVTIKLHKTLDADIIEWLDKQESRQGYIKNLIRKDIAQHRQNLDAEGSKTDVER